MQYIKRLLEGKIRQSLARDKSVLLLGARQTGKTTLVGQFSPDLQVSFVQPDIRQNYEKAPHLLRGEVESLTSASAGTRPLVILDEVQKVPGILDVVQDLIDRGKANFILTGSSARKLRRGTQVNLLPGRLVALRLDPFSQAELPAGDVSERILYGALPGVLKVKDLADRETDLSSYVTAYLEEEVRAEAAVRNLGHFARFLELAAAESGGIMNLRRLSQEVGVAHTTVGAYYQILEDCLIAERVEPLTQSRTRKKLTKSAKYVFFDLGVRRLAAHEGARLPRDIMGRLFEQYVGLELLRSVRTNGRGARIRFWRDPDGPEVDWVIDQDGVYTPVEVKWSDNPDTSDIRHLETFLAEYPSAQRGFLICRVARKARLSENVYALPWSSLEEVF